MQKNLQYVMAFAKRFKLYWILLLSVTALQSIIQVAIPYLSKIEIDQLVSRHDQLFSFKSNPFNIFIFIVLIVLITNFISQIIGTLGSTLNEYYGKRLEMAFKRDLYERMRNIRPGFFLSKRNSFFFREFRDMGDIVNKTMNFAIDALRLIFESVGIFIVFSLVDYKIGMALLAIALLTWFIEKKRRVMQEQMNMSDKFETSRKVWKSEIELINNRHLLQISGGIPFVEKYINDAYEEGFSKNLSHFKNDIRYNFINIFSNQLLTTFIKILVGYSIFRYSSSVGLMSMTIMYVGNINNIVNRFMQLYLLSYIELRTSLQKIGIVFEMTENKSNGKKKLHEPNEISIRNLSFAYPTISKEELKMYEVMDEKLKKMGDKNDRWDQRDMHFINEAIEEGKKTNPTILKGVDAKFEKGKIYGIVGRNGAGKTTLINLILGYFDDYGGEIHYGDYPLEDVDRKFFESSISYVSQLPYLMESFTIRENLLLGSENAMTDEGLYAYLDRFGLADKIRGLRKGLDSEMGFDIEFSGGQRQLLALIRAIIQNKRIIIFDEGTNQLDAENELLVMKELLRNKKDKIIIFITHRMTTIKKADHIYCIDDGKVSDSGSHYELLEKDSVYKEFWDNQVEKGFDDV